MTTTTTQHHDAINYCEDCELEYAGHRCAPCPVCPLSEKLSAAESNLRQCEPWKIVARDTTDDVQQTINSLEAHGWSLHDLRAGQSSELIALMERRDYSPERHVEAADRVVDLLAESLAKRREIEVATDEFRETRRSGER